VKKALTAMVSCAHFYFLLDEGGSWGRSSRAVFFFLACFLFFRGDKHLAADQHILY
jgi:hypothetical protein